MRLLTHNLLQCPQHGSYPLALSNVREVESIQTEYNAQFVLRMLPRLDWSVLRATALSLGVDGVAEHVPMAQPDLHDIDTARDDGMLRALHTVLVETHVLSARLVCGDGREWYAIDDGIPNLVKEAANAPCAARKEKGAEQESEGDENGNEESEQGERKKTDTQGTGHDGERRRRGDDDVDGGVERHHDSHGDMND